MRGLLIAAPASGQGKTTVTLGLLRAWSRIGIDVASGKSGPDYIDPAFHAAATGRPCVTLDAFAAPPAQLTARAAMQPADMLVVEGAMGLFDGAATPDPMGRGSAMEVARALGLGIVLVVDAARAGQGVAATVQGHATLAGGLAGVLLNRIGSARHGDLVARAVETVAPVLGVLPRQDDLTVPGRHLGLVQAGEHDDLAAFLDRAADWMTANADLSALRRAATPVTAAGGIRRLPPPGQRIALAQDAAFGFSYWHQIADWRATGAEIVPFSPLADEAPDAQADAVVLPGGYPELHAGRLSAASRFRAGMMDARDRGAIIHGECGGYMVLGDGLVDADGTRHAMLGLLRLETSFAAPRRHLGYRRLLPRGGPWTHPVIGHEFHYATTVRAQGDPLFDASDAGGMALGPMGLVEGRTSGSFAHVIECAGG